jgi:hypothetical protein
VRDEHRAVLLVQLDGEGRLDRVDEVEGLLPGDRRDLAGVLEQVEARGERSARDLLPPCRNVST